MLKEIVDLQCSRAQAARGLLRDGLRDMMPQADDFDFIRKRMQELAEERHADAPRTVQPTSNSEIVGQQALNHAKLIRRRLPGENPSS